MLARDAPDQVRVIPPLGNAQQIATLIRSELRRRVSAASPQATATSKANSSKPAVTDTPYEFLSALVTRRLRSIDRDAADAPHQAFRVFLESVLLSQFGEELINDPGFFRLVDDVHQAMTKDPSLKNTIAAAGVQLLVE